MGHTRLYPRGGRRRLDLHPEPRLRPRGAPGGPPLVGSGPPVALWPPFAVPPLGPLPGATGSRSHRAKRRGPGHGSASALAPSTRRSATGSDAPAPPAAPDSASVEAETTVTARDECRLINSIAAAHDEKRLSARRMDDGLECLCDRYHRVVVDRHHPRPTRGSVGAEQTAIDEPGEASG